jgi:hypothetical protein
MNSVFVVFDKTDKHHDKPFMGIHLIETDARTQVDNLAMDVPEHAKRLIYYTVVKLGALQ